MAAATQSPVTVSPRCGRPLTTSYVDLMRPDEDWRNLPDAAERRKIQNRLAQRAYRRNMRDRTKEVERLKKQLQQLQGTVQPRTTPPPEHDSPSGRSPVGSLSEHHNGEATPPMAHSVHYQPWQGQEQLSGLGIRTDGDAPMAFGDASFFPHGMPNNGEMVPGMATPPSSTGSSSSRRRAVNSVAPQGSMPGAQHLRSNSMGPLVLNNCPSPMHQWSGPERRESMPVTTMAPSHGRESFSMCSSPEDVAFLPAKAPYSMEQDMSQGVYPPPAEAEMQSRTGWAPSMDAASSSPLSHSYMPNSSFNEAPDMSKSMPETTAPLLHFAVASGNMDTLRFLLQRPDINLNGCDNTGYTPLQRAISMGNTEMAAVLIDHGAAVETPTFKKPSYGQPKLESQ